MKETEQASRAARSYERNAQLAPKIEERIERARSTLEGYLRRSGKSMVHLGGYQIALLQDGSLAVTRLPPEGWEQLEMTLSEKEADRSSSAPG
jgi:hypothetical protein